MPATATGDAEQRAGPKVVDPRAKFAIPRKRGVIACVGHSGLRLLMSPDKDDSANGGRNVKPAVRHRRGVARVTLVSLRTAIAAQ